VKAAFKGKLPRFIIKFSEPFAAKLPAQILFLSLGSVLVIMILLLITGTIYAFARSDNSDPLLTLGSSGETKKTSPADAQDSDIRVFSGIGRLRIPLLNSSTLILSVAFPYYAGDIAFTEELAGKITDFRGITSGYFSSLTGEELTYIDEDAAKTEILRRFNQDLRLGSINSLYFSDFLIIDGIP
jgi:flagellar basal body-associated protein FliL